MIYTLTLNPALDYDMYLDDFNKKKSDKTKKTNYKAGGKGINVSMMLKNLGKESTCIGFVTGFTGEYIKKSLEESQIPHRLIHTKEGNSKITVKMYIDGKETEISGASPTISDENVRELLDFVRNLTEHDILILSGTVPTNVKTNIYHVISTNTRAGVVLDTRGNLLLENVYENVLVKPNLKELHDVFEKDIEDFDTMFDLCQEFFKKGVKYLLISLGARGACLMTKDNILYSPVPKGEFVNTIGSGDSTVAGFVYAYLNDYSDVDKLRMAVATGSATAYSKFLGNKDLVKKLYKEVTVEKIHYGSKKLFADLD